MKCICAPLLFVWSCASSELPPLSPDHPANPNAVESETIASAAPPPAEHPHPEGAVYACPMHPEVTASEPGKTCPKCGMNLVPKKAP